MSAVPAISGVLLGAADHAKPLLVLGPSIGTSALTVWGAAAGRLAEDFHVIGWDLPGHGTSPPAAEAFSIAELARSVLGLVDDVLIERGEPGGSFVYAGNSVGGVVGLQLLLEYPGRITAATLLCTGAKIATAEDWADRAELIRSSGTAVLVDDTPGRWFAPGFTDREPMIASGLLLALRDTDRFSYAWTCDALADFDVRDRLSEINTPVLAVAGAYDRATPEQSLREIAEGVGDGRLVVLDDAAHLVPAEAPDEVARMIANRTSHRGPSTRSAS